MITSDIFIVLPFLICAFWTAVYLLDWRSSSPARHVLTVFLAVVTLLYLCHSIFFSRNHILAVYANSIYTFCNLAVFPLYYLYIRRLTVMRRITVHECVILLPTAIMCILSFLSNLAFPSVYWLKQLVNYGTRIIFVLQLVPVAWYGYRHLHIFSLQIEDYYSNTENRTVQPTEWIMWLLLFTSLASAVANYFGREYFLINPYLLAIPSAGFSILLFALGYVGMKQTFTVDDLQREETDCPDIKEPLMNEVPVVDDIIEINYENEDENGAQAKQIDNLSVVYESLESLMAVECLYLNPDLRLNDVAARLGVGRTLLSNTLNRCGGQSFSDYVNGYRVKHACQLMTQKGSTASLLTISEESGFPSETTFYRIFRKVTGLTPRQWMQSTPKDDVSKPV